MIIKEHKFITGQWIVSKYDDNEVGYIYATNIYEKKVEYKIAWFHKCNLEYSTNAYGTEWDNTLTSYEVDPVLTVLYGK